MGRDAITGLVVLAASLALFWGTLALQPHPMVPVGPGFYPRIVLGITALMGLALVIRDLVGRRRPRPAAEGKGGVHYGLVVATFGVFAAYVVSLPWLGFRVGTFLFIAAMQATLDPPRGARRWIVLVVVAAVSTAAIYFVFERYLQVLLPRGLWTGF